MVGTKRTRGAAAAASNQPEPAEGSQDAGQQQMPQQETGHAGPGMVALHRNKHFAWSPSSITAISACPAQPLVAIGFSSGDLELWDLQLTACIQRIVGRGVEVTALAWARDSLDGSWRAFCASLDGVLSEVAWRQGRLLAPLDSGAGTIWSLAARPVSAVRAGFGHSLAAACDDGSVRLFSVEGGEPGAIFERRLAQLQGRALSVAWHPAGGALVAGGVDGCVHALDPVTGQETMRITVGAMTSKPVCVWRLLVLPDGTLVSADSDGAVQFWDGKFGALLQRFTIHAADVLALAAAPDGSAVFAAGVDSQVAQFQRCVGASGGSGLLGTTSSGDAPRVRGDSSTAGAQWVYTHYKRPHSHDVRALDVAQLGPGGRAVLISGGLDAQLIAYPVASFLKDHPVRLSKCPQRPRCAVALPSSVEAALQQPGVGRLLAAQHDTVDVWQLGAALPHGGLQLQGWQPESSLVSPSANGRPGPKAARISMPDGSHAAPAPVTALEGQNLDLTTGPRHLARIQCGGRVGAAALSPCGRFVACAVGGASQLRLYLLGSDATSTTSSPITHGLGHVSIHRVKSALSCPEVAALTFVGSGYVLAALYSGGVRLFSLPTLGSAGEVEGEDGQLQLVGEVSAAELAPREGAGAALAATAAARGLVGPAAARAAAKVMSKAASSSGGAWRAQASQVSCVAASHAGDLAAVAGPAGVSLLRIAHPSSSVRDAGAAVLVPLGKVLHAAQDAPFTALAFSADGVVVGATQASGHLAVWDVAGGRPTAWSLEQGPAVTACLERLPGTPQGVKFSPDPSSRHLLVYTSGGFCSLDLSAPVDAAALVKSKRRRGAAKPVTQGPSCTPGAGPVTDAGAGGLQAASGGSCSQAGGRGAELGQGANGRVVLLRDPLVFLDFLGPVEAVLLEKPWADVVQGMLPPLQRHRYGA